MRKQCVQRQACVKKKANFVEGLVKSLEVLIRWGICGAVVAENGKVAQGLSIIIRLELISHLKTSLYNVILNKKLGSNNGVIMTLHPKPKLILLILFALLRLQVALMLVRATFLFSTKMLATYQFTANLVNAFKILAIQTVKESLLEKNSPDGSIRQA